MRAAVRHNILHHNTPPHHVKESYGDNINDGDDNLKDGDDNLKDGDDNLMFFLFLGLATIALVIVSMALFLGIMYYIKRWAYNFNLTRIFGSRMHKNNVRAVFP